MEPIEIGLMDDNFDILAKCITKAARDNPELLRYRPAQADVPALVREDQLIVDTLEEARLCVLLAEGLLLMSKFIHEPGDQAELPPLDAPLTPAKAIVLVKEHGTYRAAAKATGINRQALWRAVQKAKEEGIGVA